MRPFLAVCLCALALPLSAVAGLSVGVTEDAGKYSRDGGAVFFAQMADVGLTENAITIFWDASDPTGIAERGLLDSSVPQALARGVRVVFAVYPAKPTAWSGSPVAREQFVAFLRILATTYPQVHDFAVGNEPNQPRYWQPQFNADGSPAAAAAYEPMLARAYDALKAVNPRIRVLGLGLSEHGNDNPRAASNVSTSPVRFIRDLGAAYRASGRSTPIMDALSYHPYPAQNTDSIAKGWAWPNAGVANLDRIKQAMWDAFNGTAQPTFENGLELAIGEIGWQVGLVPGSAAAYTDKENVSVTDEANQGAIYGQVVRMLACDPSVSDLLFMHLIDEDVLWGYQSGLVRADGTRRASYDTVKAAIAQTHGRCAGKPTVWHHTTGVAGATATFGGGITVGSEEESSYSAGIVRLAGAPSRHAVSRALEVGVAPLVSSFSDGHLGGGRSATLRFPLATLAPGSYVYAVSLRATMNPDRSTLLLSQPFRVS